MSNKVRTTIVLDAPLAEHARQIAAAKGGNLSRYINDLLQKEIHGSVGDVLTDSPDSIFGKYTGGKSKPYTTRDELYAEEK